MLVHLHPHVLCVLRSRKVTVGLCLHSQRAEVLLVVWVVYAALGDEAVPVGPEVAGRGGREEMRGIEE